MARSFSILFRGDRVFKHACDPQLRRVLRPSGKDSESQKACRPLIKLSVPYPVSDYLKCTMHAWISSKDNSQRNIQSKKIVL